MPTALQPATKADAEAIAALRNAVARDLTGRHGQGWWSGCCTSKGVLNGMRHGQVFLLRSGDEVIATVQIGTRKPWAIDRSYFTACQHPLYLTAMAVAPAYQRQGLGR